MEPACSVMTSSRAQLIRRSPAENIAWGLAKRHRVEPPTEERTLVRWLKNRPHLLSWAVVHRPAECLALGLLERPLPLVIDDLRHSNLPLDPRQAANLSRCFAISGVTPEELTLGLSDMPHLLQTALGLLGGGDAAG